MRGVLGVEMDGGVERIEPALARALSAAALGANAAYPAGPWRVVTFDWDDDGRVTYEGDLADVAPLEALVGSFERTLDVVASLADSLGAIHALGIAHGDLGLDSVRFGPDGTAVILWPARRLPAGALLGARVRGGASPSVVAFAAPEVATGFEVTPASDVFAVAAIAHRLLSGHPPLGQIDFGESRGSENALAATVSRALAASPGARPSVEALGAAFREAAIAARAVAAADAARRPYRDAAPTPGPIPPAPRSPAEVSARRADASSTSTILMLLLGVGGLFVFSGAVWLVAVNWNVLGDGGRFALLALVTAGIFAGSAAAERRGNPRSGAALLVLGTELLWADGAYVLDLAGRLDSDGAWAALALGMTAVAFGLGWARRSGVFGALAAIHFAIFSVAFGEAIKTGAKTGPAIYYLAIALAYAAIASGGHAARGARLGMPFTIGACLMGWVSALAGLALVGDDPTMLFGAGWPYVVVAAASAIGLAAAREYRPTAWVAAGGIVAVAPVTTALAQSDRFAFLAVAIAVGFALVTAALRIGRFARQASSQIAAVLLGAINATVGTTILFLVKCGKTDGLAAIAGPGAGYLLTLVAVSALLIGCSYAFGRAAVKKEAYRLVELAGLAQFFGAFTAASLVRYDDWFYPTACVLVGAAVLALGVATRRAALAVIASFALVCNVLIQYFEKLRDTLPVSVLAIGFGLVLLAGGVLYERRLRPILPQLQAWD